MQEVENSNAAPNSWRFGFLRSQFQHSPQRQGSESQQFGHAGLSLLALVPPSEMLAFMGCLCQ